MADVNETQVIIAGKVLTLTGYETAEYTQKVANYINKKMEECRNAVSFRSQNKETQMLLVALNIADDYMKINEKLTENEQLIKDKDTEIYNLKHDIITIQGRLDKADDQVRTLQDKMAESSKKLIQLDAKLRTKDKSSKNSDKDEERASKSETKAEVKPESKPEPKAEPKPEPKAEAPKTESKPEPAKPEAPKVENKPEPAKPEAPKTENKPEPKAEPKPEDKTEAPKPEDKPSPAKAEDASKPQSGVGLRSIPGDKDKPIPFPYKK
ncbi:MAG: cell division protein ZapA [Lachnospiraceae bacterium]|nr:cell division protein ZapA [Lachnospiraceae bacterium]